MPLGVFRRVFLVGNLAIKVPRLRRIREAMQCNRWEREMWRTWRLKFGWSHLCPIIYADRFGFVVVMPRAVKNATHDEIDGADPDDIYPSITAEAKPDDWGRVNGRVVALDYAEVIDAQMAAEKRAYYSRTERR